MRNVLAWAAWSYALLIALWLLLRALFADQLWWLALLSTLALALFAPLPFLLAGALWRRRPAALLGMALPALAFAALYGELFIPKVRPPSAAPAVVAMTYNALTSNKDTAAILAAVRAAQPDIVGMQELTSGKRAALIAGLAHEYPYHTLDAPERFGNIGLLSRFPIEAAAPLDLGTPQPALHAVLMSGDRRLHVLVAHLSPNHLFKVPGRTLQAAAAEAYARRATEVAHLRAALAGFDAPAILLCDCNLTETSQAYAELRAALGDSFREAGWGLGLSNGTPVPLQRIDYVWHSPDLVAVAVHIGPAGGSDHRPVVATLRFAQPPGSP